MNAIEGINVTKRWKDFAINDVRFTIPQGYITGFIGPNGSGKTTIIKLIMDILQLDHGEINLFGLPHSNSHVKQRIGFVYDELFMYDDFTVKNMHKFIAPFYEQWNETLFQDLFEQFNLPYKKKLKHFSKGMKMKCSLLFALSHEPDLLIMDEPTAGLDPIFRRELLHILQDVMVREEQTILISTHITSDLDKIADHIIFINEGDILLQQSMEEVHEQYHIIKGKNDLLDVDIRAMFLGLEETNTGFQALFQGDPSLFNPFADEVIIEQATLEELMYFMIRGGSENVATSKA